MKFCQSCGNQIDENAIFCPICGARTNGDGPAINFGAFDPYNGGYQPYYDTRPSKAVAILSFIIWQAGLAIWFFCRRTRPGKANSAAKGALSRACVGMPILGLVLWILWKDDPTKREHAKISGISALVGTCICALLIVLSIVLTLAGLLNAGWYITLPVSEAAAMIFR